MLHPHDLLQDTLLVTAKQTESQIWHTDCADSSAVRSRTPLSGHPDMKVFLVVEAWKVIFFLAGEPEGRGQSWFSPSLRASLVHMLRLKNRICKGLHDGFTLQLGKCKRAAELCSSLLEKKFSSLTKSFLGQVSNSSSVQSLPYSVHILIL